SRMKPSLSDFVEALTGQKTAPVFRTAKIATTASKQFSMNTTTRSPRAMPPFVSAAARRSDMRSSSPKESRRLPATMAVFSGSRRVLSRRKSSTRIVKNPPSENRSAIECHWLLVPVAASLLLASWSRGLRLLHVGLLAGDVGGDRRDRIEVLRDDVGIGYR